MINYYENPCLYTKMDGKALAAAEFIKDKNLFQCAM